jgi:chromosome segregation ATPase
MSKNVDNITQNVKGEAEHMKHQFGNLQQNLRDLSSGNLFGQIDSMISELKRLTDLTEKYEVRYFLTCTELERRGRVVEEYWQSISSLEETLKRREMEFGREIERIREEEVNRMRRQLEGELEALRMGSAQEKTRLERRIQELQTELNRRDAEREEQRRQTVSFQETISKMKMEIDTLMARLGEGQRGFDATIAKLKTEHSQTIMTMESRFAQDMENLRRQLEEEKRREIENQKRQVSDYFSQQITVKETEFNRLFQQTEQMKARLAELERENQGLRSQLDGRVRESEDLKNQLIAMKRSHEEYTIKITETNRLALQKAVSDKERELKERLEAELARIEKELKEKKAAILALEQKIIYMEKENQRTASRLSDMTVERDELKSKLMDAEKRLAEELNVIQETMTIQIEERQSEIDRLNLSLKETSEMFSMQLEQERGRANGLGLENEMLKKEIAKLKELSEQRNREIEEWRIKYKGYITGEEANSLRDEVNRLRRLNMEYEEEITRLRSEVAKVNERLRSVAVEMDTKDHEIMNLNDLVNRRKQEVLTVQQDNDKLMGMLRNVTDLKDNVDAQKMIAEERYVVI